MVAKALTVIDLPGFDTGSYEGFYFLVTQGDAVLTIQVSDLQP